MKYIVSILFLSFTLQIYSHIRLEGEYCLDTKETKSMFGKYAFECIHLKLDGSFSYLFKNPVDEIKGFGTYKLNKKKLKLTIQYYNNGDIIKSVILKKEYPLQITETPLLTVKLYDLQDSIEMKNVNIILTDSLLIDSLKFKPTNEIRNINSDSLGKAKFEVQYDNLLIINSIIFEQPQISISNKYHTEVIIYLDEDNYTKFLSQEENVTYLIKNIEDKQFLLKKRKEKKFKKYVVK